MNENNDKIAQPVENAKTFQSIGISSMFSTAAAFRLNSSGISVMKVM